MRPASSCLLSLSIALGCASLAACSNNGSSGGPDASLADASGLDAGDDAADLVPTPPAWDQPVTRPSDSTAAAQRAACAFARGDMPAKTLGASTPVDTAIPIDTIVVVMMENRSFDSMFGHLNEYGHRADVQEPPAGASNPDQAAGWMLGDGGAGGGEAGSAADGGDDAAAADAGADASGGDAGPGPGGATHPWTHAPSLCFADTNHTWKGQHWAWDNGRNDGFYAENNGSTDVGDVIPDAAGALDGERAMWWYDQTDIPFDYQLANSFAIADNYFCSILGPTGPNRLFLVGATSFGLTYNLTATLSSTDLASNLVVPDELEQRHVSWATYSDGTPSLVDALSIGIADRYPRKVRFAFQDFLDAAKAGTLPQVAWVDPAVGLADGKGDNNDDHPPADVQVGSQFLSQVYQAVTTSPQWAHTALFITWDENGGEYDHVPPPPACAPDGTPLQFLPGDEGIPGDLTTYGFRVPLIVVSPYAKKAYASHNVYDHTSIARFIEARFKIPALTARDANADALMDLFDFADPPSFLSPPSIPAPVVDPAALQSCVAQWGSMTQ